MAVRTAECYKSLNDGLFMEEKQNQERCKRCHGGILYPTLNPNERKCNYCGWSKTEINFADYVASKGYVGP